jgi:hypothetical protein
MPDDDGPSQPDGLDAPLVQSLYDPMSDTIPGVLGPA